MKTIMTRQKIKSVCLYLNKKAALTREKYKVIFL